MYFVLKLKVQWALFLLVDDFSVTHSTSVYSVRIVSDLDERV